jgi:hypothetical protein
MMEERFKNPHAKALYKKALEIHDLVRSILAAAPEGVKGSRGEMLRSQMDDMRAGTTLIPAKIAGAEAADLYDLRMENAALIRKAARELVVGLRGLEMFGFDAQDYFNLLRTEVEEFRKLFVVWVAGFDKGKYFVDNWGLFNPPGVKPGDESPDIDFGDEDDDGRPF